MSELPSLAASGRTSIPNDKEIQKSLYRATGYRVAGTRAVRVDILERLADLIRPAIAWKPGAPGEKPQGAIDGFGFTVSVGMTSLVGCAGEDFASILKALGYRMDRRPATLEAKPAEAAIEAAATAETAETTPEVVLEPAPPPPPAMLEVHATVTGAEVQPAPETTAPASPSVVAEPAMVEIWRPGRPRPDRKPERNRRPRKDEAKPADGAPQEASSTGARERPHHERRDKRGKDQNKDRNKDRGPRKDAAQFNPRPERKEKPIDPNSPFASLLALKERLEADKKGKG